MTTFRPGQRALIEAALAAVDSLGVLPTGGGKSLCYQLPALVLARPTVVVSPLIALIKDQRDHLARAHVDAAELDSTLDAAEERASDVEIRRGDHPVIYLTPERLQSEACIAMLQVRGVGLVAIDEAHCVSQWGHDFRPAYLRIADVVKRLGRPPVMALTATCTTEVANDIVTQLGLDHPLVVRPSVERPNLAFHVHTTVNEEAKRVRLLDLLTENAGKTGIVYVATVQKADEIFQWLGAIGVTAARYHGHMKDGDREESRHAFMSGRSRVMIATKAFGMGIDKPDVRFVVHHQFPDSLESYYQEAGRAGRDGKPASAHLLYQLEDRRIQTYFLCHKYPRRADTLALFDALCLGAQETTVDALIQATKLPERKTRGILVHLEQLGALTLRGNVVQRRVKTEGSGEVQRLIAAYATRLAHDRTRLAAMMHYGQTTECRMRVLLNYFGEERREGCGRCDNCQRRAEFSHGSPKVASQL